MAHGNIGKMVEVVCKAGPELPVVMKIVELDPKQIKVRIDACVAVLLASSLKLEPPSESCEHLCHGHIYMSWTVWVGQTACRWVAQ